MNPEQRIEKTLELITLYGGIDGGHHKQWVLDQVLRILTDCPIIQRTWIDVKGTEYTFDDYGESEEYNKWLVEYQEGDDGPTTYEWDIGIAP